MEALCQARPPRGRTTLTRQRASGGAGHAQCGEETARGREPPPPVFILLTPCSETTLGPASHGGRCVRGQAGSEGATRAAESSSLFKRLPHISAAMPEDHLEKNKAGGSLVAGRFRICLLTQGMRVQSPAGGLRPPFALGQGSPHAARRAVCCAGTRETLTDKYQVSHFAQHMRERKTPLSPRRSSGGVLLVSADGSAILPVAQVEESFLSLLSSIPCFILQRMLLLLRQNLFRT